MHSFLLLYFSYILLRARCIIRRYRTKAICGRLCAGGIASCVGGVGALITFRVDEPILLFTITRLRRKLG